MSTHRAVFIIFFVSFWPISLALSLSFLLYFDYYYCSFANCLTFRWIRTRTRTYVCIMCVVALVVLAVRTSSTKWERTFSDYSSQKDTHFLRCFFSSCLLLNLHYRDWKNLGSCPFELFHYSVSFRLNLFKQSTLRLFLHLHWARIRSVFQWNFFFLYICTTKFNCLIKCFYPNGLMILNKSKSVCLVLIPTDSTF